MPNAAKQLEEKELSEEFVVGGFHYRSDVRSLESIDYLQQNLTPENLKKMRFDSEVESSVEFLIDSVFADGVAAVSCITDEDSEDFDEAKKITEFVGEAISGAARSLESVIRELFRGAFYGGAKVGEIVLEVNNESNLVLNRINPKPQSSVGFVCDKFNNVLGLVGAKENGSIAFNPAKDDIIPREKFLILQFELEDNDPRGVKKIRACFDAWCDKKDTRPQYKEWRRTSAIPKKVGTTPQDAKEVQLRNPDGTPLIINGIPQKESAQKNMMTALEGFANNSTVVVPFGANVNQLEVNGTGSQFTLALKFNNAEIRKAILGDSLATGEADKDARAAKQVAVTVVDLRVSSFRNSVAEAVKRDVFRLLTMLNFGADKAHLTPNCSLGDTERRDWEKTATALAKVGYQMTDEHQREADAVLGFTPRDKDWKSVEKEDSAAQLTEEEEVDE